MRGKFFSQAHRLWQMLPENGRRELFYATTAALAPHPPRHPVHAERAGVVGLFQSGSGLGEGARLALQSMRKTGFDPSAYDVSHAFDHHDLVFDVGSFRPLEPGPETLIVHINGPYMALALWSMGRKRLAGKRIIGYWAWELPRLPKSWRRGFEFVHEIWAPSRFVREAVEAETKKPVRVVPHPLWPATVAIVDPDALGIARDAVVVLHVSNIATCAARKNPMGAITAFRRAFGDRPDRVLLLKLSGLAGEPEVHREVEEALAGATNVRLIDHMVPRATLDQMMMRADIGLSLHRAEGFGLFMAEMMHLGKAMIATGWSGNMDFMNSENSMPVSYRLVPARDPQRIYDEPDQSWADADIDHAVELLRKTADDADFRRRIGLEAARSIYDAFNLSRYSNIVAEGIGIEGAFSQPV